MQIILAQPRGFCAGVVRAIEIVERSLERRGAPVYVRHEIVHNKAVVEGLRAKGAVFVEALEAVPPGAVTVFSAHGVARAVEGEARERGLEVFDATCPLVAKVHIQGRQYAASGRTVVLIGHAGHPEVEGTMGQIDGRVLLVQDEGDVDALDLAPDTPVAYVTQTTLSVDDTRGVIAALERRFTDLVGPDVRDICYATQNRQRAVRALCQPDVGGGMRADVLLVVGAPNSSNSNRLREIGAECGIPSYLLADGSELDPAWVAGAHVVGITAGASAPEAMVEHVIDALRRLGPVEVATMDGIAEHVEFKLPAALAAAAPTGGA
jgi:4-hydroxy-3-methylbut-2-enyl diphosphate reductase